MSDLSGCCDSGFDSSPFFTNFQSRSLFPESIFSACRHSNTEGTALYFFFFSNFGLATFCAEARVFFICHSVFSYACCWSALCCSVYTQTHTSHLAMCRSRKHSLRTQFAPCSKHNPSMEILYLPSKTTI